MNAAILSIGDEFTHGDKVDAHASWLSSRLAELTVRISEHRTVGDNRRAIAAAIRELAADRDVLIITGGLGPTADDLTRFGLGDVTDPGAALISDESAVRHLRARFRKAGRDMPDVNLVQAQHPPSASFIDNPHGTAPGLRAKIGQCLVYALPGPAREMHEMFQNHVRPEISNSAAAKRDGEAAYCTAIVRAYGIGESDAAARLGDLMSRDAIPLVGLTVSKSLLVATVRAVGPPGEMTPLVNATADRIEDAWGPYAYARGDDTLAGSVGAVLEARQLTLATAESCTGGLLGELIVDVSGCSEYYLGGWVTYSDELKVSELGVPKRLLDQRINRRAPGAVSDDVAHAMAQGAISRSGADYSLAITGIAGPDGGTPDKPAGTVYIAVGRSNGPKIDSVVRRFRFPGDRFGVRDRAAKSALQMLRWAVLAPRSVALEDSQRDELLWQVSVETGRA